MKSPNAGKSAINQTMCIARALTAYDPESCDESVALWRANTKLEQEGDPVYDQWIRVITNRYERYYQISKSGAGRSVSQLPEGETVIRTIDIRDQRPASQAFSKLVAQYNARHEDFHIEFDQSIADRLRMTLDACGASYNEDKIREFRNWLGTVAETIQIGDLSIPAVSPDHLLTFSRNLATLRTAYAADTCLFGSFATASQICIDLPREITPSNGPNRHQIFMNLAAYLTMGKVYHPVRILNGVIQQCIDNGFITPLMEIADSYRQKVNTSLVTAKTATSMNDYLENIYKMIPFAHGAHLIYFRLQSNKSKLSPHYYRQAKGAAFDIEEILVRLIDLFKYEILDFEGQIWDAYREKIRYIRQSQGKDAALREVENLVNRFYVYPDRLATALLAD